jgi:hypothetical protein
MTCSLGSNTTVLRPGWILDVYADVELYQPTFAPLLGTMENPGGTLTIFSGSTPVPASGGASTTPLPHILVSNSSVQISQLQSVTAPITAVYSGDANYASCTSAPLQLTYDTSPSASAIWVTANPQLGVTIGTPISAFIQVGPAAAPPTFEPLYPAATGSVQLALDGINIGSPLTLSPGVGTFPPAGYANYGAVTANIPTTGIAAGPHVLTVNYPGDANFQAAGPYNYDFIFYVPDFSLALAPTTATVTNGQTTQPVSVTVQPGTGFTGTVTFSCSGLPQGATCIFTPNSVMASGSTSLTITTTQAEDVRVPVLAQSSPHKENWLAGAGGFACAFLIVLVAPRRWRKTLGLCIVVAFVLVFAITSCGNGSSGGGSPPPPPLSTTTTLSAGSLTPAKGANDAIVATVSGGTTAPTGTVQFSIDGANSGSPVALSNSTALLVASFAKAGPHTVSAVYSGDASHESSTSIPLTINVPYTTGSIPGTYNLTITATSGSLAHSTNLTLTVQ